MYITSFFTKNGSPKEGLLPLIKIIDVDTNIVIINNEQMIEIGSGWYKYNFTTFDSSKDYVIVCDGTSVLSNNERYMYGGNDIISDDISDIIWNSNVSNHQIHSSFGELLKDTNDKLKRTLGLLHENIYIDSTIYDTNGNLTSARVRIYSNAGSVGTDNDVIGSYILHADCSQPGKFNNWSQIKI